MWPEASLRERAPATTSFTIADRLCACVCGAVWPSQFADRAFPDHIGIEAEGYARRTPRIAPVSRWLGNGQRSLAPRFTQNGDGIPPAFRTGLGAFRACRIDGLAFRRREILAVRKLCRCLCHFRKARRVASSWLSSAQCPHSAAILQHSSANDCMALLHAIVHSPVRRLCTNGRGADKQRFHRATPARR